MLDAAPRGCGCGWKQHDELLMTELLEPDAGAGDLEARARLFATLYKELHSLAHRALKRASGQLSMSTTTLLHEVYLNLNNREGISFPDHGRFLAYAAQAIRGHIVDATRRRLAHKRGRGCEFTGLRTDIGEEIAQEQQLIHIDEAQTALWALDDSLGELVDLKYFCGLSLAEIGALRGVTERTMQREWHKARLLLFQLLHADSAS
jgi:RNA polymerase sigma factor (TIGR02999 family)